MSGITAGRAAGRHRPALGRDRRGDQRRRLPLRGRARAGGCCCCWRSGCVGVLAYCLFWVLYEGVGVWGNNIPVTWALDIVGYDWWIGVATGGLFVSALLLLIGAEWRGAVSRLTETMALLAAAAAGLYPIIHLGRPWFFYWNLPYPNTFALWPQFRSPLYWDAVDIISFLVVCLTPLVSSACCRTSPPCATAGSSGCSACRAGPATGSGC